MVVLAPYSIYICFLHLCGFRKLPLPPVILNEINPGGFERSADSRLIREGNRDTPRQQPPRCGDAELV